MREPMRLVYLNCLYVSSQIPWIADSARGLLLCVFRDAMEA